jgi:hypothetical protein
VASTSTNKQPCLIDRPFLRGARITSATPTADPTNPNLTDLVQLVRVGDLPSEDAALVEDIAIVSNEDYPDNSGMRTVDIGLYVYAPNQSAPSTSAALMVGRVEVGLSGSTVGYPKAFSYLPRTPLLLKSVIRLLLLRSSSVNLRVCIWRKVISCVLVTSAKVTQPCLVV